MPSKPSLRVRSAQPLCLPITALLPRAAKMLLANCEPNSRQPRFARADSIFQPCAAVTIPAAAPTRFNAGRIPYMRSPKPKSRACNLRIAASAGLHNSPSTASRPLETRQVNLLAVASCAINVRNPWHLARNCHKGLGRHNHIVALSENDAPGERKLVGQASRSARSSAAARVPACHTHGRASPAAAEASVVDDRATLCVRSEGVARGF